MFSGQFLGLGTKWTILLDEPRRQAGLIDDLHAKSLAFEQAFSRFKPDTQATQFKNQPAGEYPITDECRILLSTADQLRKLTASRFDPAVGGLLELAGYDANYSLTPQTQTSAYHLPTWSLTSKGVKISGPVVFDFGGIGKGYWIDQLANYLKILGYQHYLVEGGGDMFGTTKADGSAWQVALEWPGEPDKAVGQVSLHNQGLAVSDVHRRAWGKWHHLIDTTTNQPTHHITWCAAVAPSAWLADQMTSVLSLADIDSFPQIKDVLSASYLYRTNHSEFIVSPNWVGELF